MQMQSKTAGSLGATPMAFFWMFLPSWRTIEYQFCLRVCLALPWLLSDSNIVGAERIRMYFITVVTNAPQISFTAATDNQLDPSQSISLLSMTLTMINGAEHENSRRVRSSGWSYSCISMASNPKSNTSAFETMCLWSADLTSEAKPCARNVSVKTWRCAGETC